MCSRLLLFSALFARGAVLGIQFDYNKDGQDWEGQCQLGLRQSPVPLNRSQSDLLLNLQPLILLNYNKAHFTVSLKPKTVEMRLRHFNPYDTVGIGGGGLQGFYALSSVHFHWDSEHVIDSKRYALEAHYVHKKMFSPDGNATEGDPEAIAVLAVLFYLSKNADPYLENIVKGLSVGSMFESEIRPIDLMPSDMDKFYRYSGSLTTPPCVESVVWSVFTSKRTISQEQLNWFKQKTIPNREPVLKNARVLQSLHGRTVNFIDVSTRGGSSIVHLRYELPLILLLLHIITYN